MDRNERYRKRYAVRKAEHRCVRCGCRDSQTMSGRVECGLCSDASSRRRRSLYKRRLSENCCAQCGRCDARTAEGRSLCARCARVKTEKQRAANLEKTKARYHALKAQHRCVKCGVELPDGYPRVRCRDCMKMDRIKYGR